MSWAEQICRWSIAYAFLDFYAQSRGKRWLDDWKARLEAYARGLGLDPNDPS